MNRFDYDNEGRYLNFLGLCAHEYFHLWNVKRLRPAALGPFNYDKENYTHMLWVAEGITNYYDELIPARAGYIDDNRFLANLAGRINSVENRKGNQVQSLASASWNAWIKAYRPNENSMNTTVSYYTKGLVVASMLDILITKETNGEKHLDDLMQSLYKSFYLNKKRGFTDDEFVQEVSRMCGSDQTAFFKEFVFSTTSIDYNRFFDMVGLKLVDTNKKDKVKLGIKMNGTTIKYVETASSAYTAGLNVNDEILAIDGIRISTSNFNDIVSMYPNKTVELLIGRDHLIRTIKVKIGMNEDVSYILEKLENASSIQRKLYNKWMFSVN
jgi:predicted metalloprotease with PDZ domain